MRVLVLLLAGSAAAFAWQAPQKNAEAEERELETALAEAGTSAVEYSRVLEDHLKKYPESSRREEIVRVLTRAAVDAKDKRRLVEYGVPVVEAGNRDPLIIEHVTRALLDRTDKESLERAERYAKRLQQIAGEKAAALRNGATEGPSAGRRLEDEQMLLGRALCFEARAAGSLDKKEDAVALARRAYDAYPGAEPAREAARWLERSGRAGEAAEWVATAMTIPDARTTDAQRRGDREKLGGLYRKATGSETGLGDVVLRAMDRGAADVAKRQAELRAFDPNYDARQIMDFTLRGTRGNTLSLASLKGKVAVLDFWATWCGPCRAQYPLYEDVKQRFKDRKDVVFVAISTDEDRSVVGPFLDAQKWSKQSYFDEGLSSLLRINSIPTTIVVNRDGVVVSRMSGFIADRFVDMLSARVEAALTER